MALRAAGHVAIWGGVTQQHKVRPAQRDPLYNSLHAV
jgi:hypothetical protein